MDRSLKVVHESSVAFDNELGEFGLGTGVEF